MKIFSNMFTFLVLLICFFSCTTIPNNKNSENIANDTHKTNLLLTFAGDIMGHTNVTRMKNYDLIFSDITDILQSDDLSFCNIETPIDDNQEYENYPTFNVKNDYADNIIESGFEVFSLINNHTNDQDLEGIKNTKEYFDKSKQTKSSKIIEYSGIKNKENDPFTYSLFTIKNKTILFMAVTEILNQYKFVSWLDYLSTTENSRKRFLTKITEYKQKYEPDIFILSVHCNEPEYVRIVSDKRKVFYKQLLQAGVDIVWANHPHVTQEWEEIRLINNPLKAKYIMYSIGNTISGQRFRRNYKAVDDDREYTGDSVLLQLNFFDTPLLSSSTNYSKILITTHTDKSGNSYVKKLNNTFLSNLSENDQIYYQKRIELMNNIKGNILWE